MLDSLIGEFDVGTKLGDIQFEAYEGQEDVKSIFDLVISWWYAVEAKNFTIFKSAMTRDKGESFKLPNKRDFTFSVYVFITNYFFIARYL